MTIIELFSGPLGAVVLGFVSLIITSIGKKFNINPNYGALIFSGLIACLVALFKFVLDIETQDQIIAQTLYIFATATALFNIFIKPFKKNG